MPKEETINIKIPKALYGKIQSIIIGTSYESVDEYVINKLLEGFPSQDAFNEEEEKIIKERLKRLGYLE